jgi:NADH-quinone oxidoreductase subunit G
VPIKDNAGLVQISNRRDLVLPASNTLFTSGSLGRHSAILNELQHYQPRQSLIQIDKQTTSE